MPVPFRRPTAASLRGIASAGIGYFAFTALALQLTRCDGGFAVVWLAGAMLFARLLTVSRRRWPGIVAGCLAAGAAASALFGIGRGIAVPLAAVGAAEAAGAAWLVKRLCPRFGRFQSTGETARFLAVAGLLAPALGAAAAAGCAHFAAGLRFWPMWRDWFAGHALGMIAFAPPLLLSLRGGIGRRVRAAGPRGRGEAAGLLAAVALASAAAFGQGAVPLVLVPFVPMVAATLRLGRFGAVASVVILMAVGLACSLAGIGPTNLLPGGMGLKLQVLQGYFATAVLILLPLAAELQARRRLLNRLRAADTLHRLILDQTGDVVLRLGIDGRVRYASPAVLRAWNLRPERLIGRAVLDFVEAEDRAGVAEARRAALASPEETVAVEYRVRRPDGAIAWAESRMRATVDQAGRVTGTVTIVREVTRRRRLVEDLARQATTDPLTGLSNRRAFNAALAARLVAGPGRDTGCVAAFDLDHFKRVNDRWGHAVGDAVLVRFAQVLLGAVREGDVVARLGGEEFAVLLGGASVEQAARICERVRAHLAAAEIRAPSGEAVRATVSVGVAPLGSGHGADETLAAADAALYRAKTGGRNRLALVA